MARVDINEAGIEALKHDPDGEVAQIMERSGYAVENEAKRLLLLPGSGGIYGPGVKFFRRGGKVYRWERIGTHQASAPGEPAASDTGLLLNSVEHFMDEDDNGVFARVGTRLNEGEWTELGTRFMAERPWLRPALDVLKVENG